MSSPVTIQPSTADTFLSEANPTTNYCNDVSIQSSPGYPPRLRSPFSFDFSAVVPAGATVTKAILSLYSWAYTTGRTLTVFRLLRTDWVELEATWNQFKAGSAWVAAGALGVESDYTVTDLAIAASPSVAAWVTWDVTNQVKTARDTVGGVAHFLLADTMNISSSATNTFRSRNYVTDPTLRPKLYIEYVMPIPPPQISITQSAEQCRVTVVTDDARLVSAVTVIVDGKAYPAVWEGD